MQRLSIVVPMLAMASLVVATSAGGVPAKDSFALKGEVYATGFKIEMENAAGRKLRSIRAGTYRIKIEDKATIHNFRLRGPGINRAWWLRAGRTGTCTCPSAGSPSRSAPTVAGRRLLD